VRFEEIDAASLPPIEVAVLDSGIDATHPDLEGRVTAAFEIEEPAEVVEVPPGDNRDTFGHGTAVASIIARIAPHARMASYRVLGPRNAGAGRALIAALRHAVDRGARVINMSLAARKEFGAALWPICDKAYRRGQVVVASKRNMPLVGDLGFPAELSSVISVDRKRFPTPYELRYLTGGAIEFAAHGDDVVVAAPGGGYTEKTGTSFATPAVSGLCALLLAAHPELRPFEVKTVLKAAADDAIAGRSE
jgi:subtilisin family serine protease